MSDAPVPSAAERSQRIAFRRGVTLLALTLVLPGSAQLVAGGKGLGRFALRVWGALLALILGFLLLLWWRRDWAVALYANPITQSIAAVVVLIGGIGWTLLVLDAWRLSQPRHMGRRAWVMGALSTVLAVALSVGSAQASALSRSQADLFGAVLGGGGDTTANEGRINILLLGADAEEGRPGIRTDTIMVASVSATTGRTVLFSLPRNLQWAPFPQDSPLHDLYPDGYWCQDESCLLNAVHSEAENRADLFDGVKDPGLTAVRGVVSETLGLELNYFAMVDMRGFESLVDALGGVTLDIAKAVPIGGGSSRIEGWIQPGESVHLDGFQALWFARSREGSSDYERMARQKCIVNALARHVTPFTVVTRFTELAAAGSSLVRTDVPSSQLVWLAELADQGRRLPIASVSFAPPLIQPVKPEFALIRSTVEASIDASEELDRVAAEAARASASATPSPDAVPAAEPTAAASATPEPTTATIATAKPSSSGDFSSERTTDDLTDICSVG